MDDSSQATGRGKNKRKWSSLEEETLLDFMLELKLDPRWKCEGGFKNGFHECLAQKMTTKFTSCGLKASQVESKIKFLKEKYNAISDMLKLSRFQWDDKNKTIQCERQSYDDFCVGHARAKGLWKTPFPHFEKLQLIYEADRADGSRCEDVDDSSTNMNIELENDAENDVDGPRKRQKKGKAPLGYNEKFVTAIDTIKDHMGVIANTWKETEKREQEVVHQKNIYILTEIAMIDGVSRVDAIDATSYLSRNSTELDTFYSCPNDEWKKLYVERLLLRLRGFQMQHKRIVF